MNTDQLDGTTRLFAIIGDPISAVRSPAAFNAMFARANVKAVLLPLHVAAPDLKTAWAGLKAIKNLDGVVVTMPHKTAMCKLVDELGDSGRVVGAVNAVRCRSDGRWEADMFDGIGCVQGLKAQGHEVAGRNVFLVGLGGAGVAIAAALAQTGAKRLVITDLDTARQNRVAERLRAAYPAAKIETGNVDNGPFDLAINATPMGMKPDDPLPFDPGRLPETTLIVDVVPKPEMTAFLERAQKTGHAVHPGRHMHHGQMVALMKFFGFDLSD